MLGIRFSLMKFVANSELMQKTGTSLVNLSNNKGVEPTARGV